ncbi:hypothetical protein NPIL_631801 [Nephila pilipes]|uniref:Uncharacterized protein n=1 Tax=Nephila pilipes TaxID=299642 RepID=A0A8X6TXY2_NEPPI|nr:hypothetical protein NPIL_631801 [Nephila pilipes]
MRTNVRHLHRLSKHTIIVLTMNEAKRFSQHNRELRKRECVPLPEIKIRKSCFLCKFHFLVPLCALRKPFLSAQGLGAPVAGIKSYPSIDVAPENSHANPMRFLFQNQPRELTKVVV